MLGAKALLIGLSLLRIDIARTRSRSINCAGTQTTFMNTSIITDTILNLLSTLL